MRSQANTIKGASRCADVKVLCVENYPEYMSALKDMLESAGYQVMTATTAAQALTMVQAHSLLGVVLEFDLPDATVAAVRAEMKRIKPEVPVLLFNGVGSETPFFFRFFSSYFQNFERPENVFRDLEN
jgi:DNA-binding NtrC family response regulator